MAKGTAIIDTVLDEVNSFHADLQKEFDHAKEYCDDNHAGLVADACGEVFDAVLTPIQTLLDVAKAAIDGFLGELRDLADQLVVVIIGAGSGSSAAALDAAAARIFSLNEFAFSLGIGTGSLDASVKLDFTALGNGYNTDMQITLNDLDKVAANIFDDTMNMFKNFDDTVIEEAGKIQEKAAAKVTNFACVCVAATQHSMCMPTTSSARYSTVHTVHTVSWHSHEYSTHAQHV